MKFCLCLLLTLVLSSSWLHRTEAAMTEELVIDSAGDTYNRTTEGGINFTATNLNVGSAGTGLISPFLQTSGFGGTETQGYTSDRADGQFNEVEGKTRSLMINEPSTFGNFTEFLLDVGEPNVDNKKFITIDQIQIFAATSDYATDPNLSGTLGTTAMGDPLIAFDPLSSEEIFRLADDNIAYSITIDASLGAGGGQYDMRLFIDFSALDLSDYTHYIFYVSYTQQHPLGEEWSIARDDLAAVPEPSTWAMLLITACGAIFIQYRQQRKQKLTTDADEC